MAMRRVLICNYEYPPLGGGGGTCSHFLAKELCRLGHRVEVVTSRWGDLPREVRRKRYRLLRLPVLRKLPGQSNPIEMLSYVAAAVPYLLLRVGPLPDVVISFHSIPSGLAAFPLSLLRGVPHIVLFRGGDVPGWLPGQLESMHRRTLWLNRLIVHQAAAALANSDGLRDLAAPSFPKQQVGVLYNGVDQLRYRPPAEGRGHRSGPVRLVFAGRITPQKGIDTLLRALARPEMKGLAWSLDLGGDGPQLEEYRSLAETLGLGERVRFHGWLSREAVSRLYRDGDLLVFPSRYEGMPNVVLEAMSCGLPIIGTRIAGTEQLVRPGENGLLVEPDDEEGLGRALATLVADREKLVRFGEASRRAIEAEWAWSVRGRQLEEVIERVIEERG
jgi:glycosyltransferase involved in cell wall biosynthesis